TGKQMRAWKFGELKESLRSVAWSPDGQQVLVGGNVTLNEGHSWSTFRLIDPDNGKELFLAAGSRLGPAALPQTPGHPAPVAIAPVGKVFAGAASEDVILVRRTDSVHTNQTKHKGISALAFAPDGKTIVSAGREGAVRFIDVKDLKEVAVVGKQGEVLALA